ncbi:MAG TPA: tetratricopeptide repeat protein [Candidatus Baltobacteraceae bacterium]|nr:tetratricopeptide repeat protein [Candidatus Baltobacteraceae bacterium]
MPNAPTVRELHEAATSASIAADYLALADLARQMIEVSERTGDARGMLGLAVVALDVDADASEARHLYDLAAPILRAAGDERGLGNVLGNLGEIYRLEGSPRRAEQHAEEALDLFRKSGNNALAGWQLSNVAHFRLLQRDEIGAIDNMHEAYDELAQNPVPR